MIEEILSLGFSHVELSHGLPLSLLPGITEMIAQNAIYVTSVHNYFPAPIDVLGDAPDRYEFTSHRPEIRERAIALTQNSIKMAAEFGASRVVLHLGSVSMLPRDKSTTLLKKIAQKGQLNTLLYQETKTGIVELRHKFSQLYLDRAKQALDALLPTAQEYNIQLGIEGRSHYEQVPNAYELGQLFTHYATEPLIGYWHDFGHIQRQENLLFLNHKEFLHQWGNKAIGCHVNDICGLDRDHQIPFQGELDFDILVPHLPPSIPFVWELSSRRDTTSIREALALWKIRYPQTLA